MRIWVLLLSLLISSPVFAEIKWERYDFFENSGGLNDGFSQIAVGDKEASDLQNVVFTTSGSFKTRDGYDRLSDPRVTGTTLQSSISANGLRYFKPTSGSEFIVGVFSNDSIKKMDYGSSGPDGTWDDITGALSFSASANNLATFALGQDTLIIEDGIGTTSPYKWTGTGDVVYLQGNAPTATIVAYHKRMAFAAGSSTNPSTLYFTDVGDIENWDTGLSGNVSVETNDGSVIRALVPGFDALYIFKDKSIWRLTGDDKDTFVLQRMVSDLGVTSPNAVSLIGNEFIFTSSQGNVYIYDGSIGVKLISSKIDGTLEAANFDRFQYVASTVFDDDYYLAISSSGSDAHDILMVYDTFNEGWTKFVGIKANALAVADNGSGEDMLIFGDYLGYVYNYPDGTNDDGRAISSSYITKQYRFPESGTIKDWRLLRVFAAQKGSYNLSVETRSDFIASGTIHSIALDGSGSLWGTAVYGVDSYGGENVIVGRLEVNDADADFFQIKFSNSSIDQPIEVRGWQVFIESQDKI